MPVACHSVVVAALAATLAAAPLAPAAFPEKLDRGLVAAQTSDTSAFLSWRLLASDPDDTAFHVHRISTLNDSDSHLALYDPCIVSDHAILLHLNE